MNYTIIGGGFGLYGYLPALMARGENVTLPNKYKDKLFARSELKEFIPRIRWVDSQELALFSSQSVIIATPPAVQKEVIELIVYRFPNIVEFNLEKPIAESPESASRTLGLLHSNFKRVSIGYVFLYSGWGQQLAAASRSTDAINICWHFKAHHFVNDWHIWKRDHHQGGGPLRYYGIHVIALLCRLGYTKVKRSQITVSSQDIATGWKATFSDSNLVDCSIDIQTYADGPVFLGKTATETIFSMNEPFAKDYSRNLGEDKRVTLIIDVLQHKNNIEYEFFRRVNSLWQEAENLAF